MKTTTHGTRVKSKIDKDIARLVFGEKSPLTTELLANEIKPDESELLRQALIHANMIRITSGNMIADLYIDGVLRTIHAFRLQQEREQ